MVVIVIIACVVLWLFIQAHLADAGVPPRSRGSLRYQRRKARGMGVDYDQVDVKARVPSTWSPSEPIGESHVGDLKWGLLGGLGGIAVMAVGTIIIAASGLSGDWVFGWWAVVIAALWILDRRRKARHPRED